MGFENIIDGFSGFFVKIKEDKLVMFILIVLLSLYASLWVESVQKYTVDIFSNKYFRFVIFVLITYIASGNPALGVILAIAVLVTLQTIIYTSISNKSEKFSPSDYNNNNNNFLTNPLLKQKELTKMGNSVNLKLQTPTELYEKMIKQGRILLDDSMELKNDLKTRFDIREQQIADTTERDGNLLVQSGINRLQSANNGEYNSLLNGSVALSQMSDDDKFSVNHRSSYIKYDRFMQNFADNEVVMDLFNLLKSKYNELTMNKSLTSEDFDNKLQEIYDTEFDLLVAIAKVKTTQMKNTDEEKINKKIEYIKDLRANKNPKFYDELISLSSLLCS
jgi:hypothetical protein